MLYYWGVCGPVFLRISNAFPAEPSVLAVDSFAAPDYYNQRIADLAVRDRTVYLDCLDSIAAFDMSDPADPIGRAPFYMPHGLYPARLKIVDSVMIVSSGLSTIGLLNIANPDSIKTLSIYDAGTPVGGLEISGTIMCVLLASHELRLVNIANPLAPEVMGSATLPSYPLHMAVQDSHLFFPGYGILYVLDLGGPSAPALVDSCDVTVYPQDVVADSRYIYVVDGAGSIEILKYIRE